MDEVPEEDPVVVNENTWPDVSPGGGSLPGDVAGLIEDNELAGAPVFGITVLDPIDVKGDPEASIPVVVKVITAGVVRLLDSIEVKGEPEASIPVLVDTITAEVVWLWD